MSHLCFNIPFRLAQGSSDSPDSSITSFNSEFSSSSSSNSSSQYGGGTVSPFEEDVLMDPVLDYINGILMDEHMEDQACMEHDCLRYKAIVNGFYDILGSESDHASLNINGWCTSTGEDQIPCSDGDLEHHPGDLEQKNRSNSTGGDYSWIERVLVSGLPSTPTLESTSESAPPLQEAASDQYALLLQQDLKDVLPTAPSKVQLSFIKGELESSLPYGGQLAGNLAVPGLDGKVRLLDDAAAPGEAPRYAWQHPVCGNGRSVAGLRSVSLPGEFQLTSLAQGMEQFVKSEYARSVAGSAGLHEVVEQYTHVAESVNGGGGGGTREEGYVSFVKNENLKAEEDAKLHGEWKTPGELKPSAKKAPGKGRPKGGRVGDTPASTASVEPYSVDLRGLLVSCAQAVADMQVPKAQDLLAEIRGYASPHGNGVQRLAHYFSEALAARLASTGARLYTAMAENRPSAARMLKAFNVAFQMCPFQKIAHYFANHSILRAAEGAARLHIVDYGILYGIQWPSLISALAERKGGPPFLHITGIEFPQPGADPAVRVEETGRRLADYAKTYHVPFEFTAVAKGWEEVRAADMRIAQGEVVVVNCIKRLRHLQDESVVAACPRKKVLANIRALEPDLFVTSVVNAGFNAPYFVSRFRELLYYYSSHFDMVDTLLEADNPERMLMEADMMGRKILNVVACEGPERVERPETYKQWQGRIQRAGFEQNGLDPAVLARSRALVKSFYHKDFGVHDDSNRWMLLGWKGRISQALCTWKPAHP